MVTLQQSKKIAEYISKNGYDGLFKAECWTLIKKFRKEEDEKPQLQMTVICSPSKNKKYTIQATIQYFKRNSDIIDIVYITKEVNNIADFLDFEKRATKAEAVAKIFRLSI